MSSILVEFLGGARFVDPWRGCIRIGAQENNTQGTAMKRAAISVALLVISLVAWAAAVASAPKAPAPKQDDAPKQTQVQIVGTDQSPLVVKVQPPQVDKDEIAKAEEDRQEAKAENKKKAKSDDSLIFWTEMLAGVGIAQALVFIWQGFSLRATIEEMKKGTAETKKLAEAARDQSIAAKDFAGAANKHALALMHAERAYLFVEFELNGIFGPKQGEPTGIAEVVVTILNNGKTPAKLVKARAYLQVATQPPQALIEHPGASDELPPGHRIEQGGLRPMRVRGAFSKEEFDAVGNMTSRMHCVGTVEYEDIFHERRHTSFCAVLSNVRQGNSTHQAFVIEPRSSLNDIT